MGNNTYLSYLLSEIDRWAWIGKHADECGYTETNEITTEILFNFLILLENSFPKVYCDLVEFVKEGIKRC